jgi:hypothetical protein
MNYKQTDNLSELILAMVNFNSEFQNTKLVKDGKNDHLKNKYLTLDNILNTVRPILTKHGLVIVQALAGEYLVTTIYHVSGQYIQTDMPFHPMSGIKAQTPCRNSEAASLTRRGTQFLQCLEYQLTRTMTRKALKSSLSNLKLKRRSILSTSCKSCLDG